MAFITTTYMAVFLRRLGCSFTAPTVTLIAHIIRNTCTHSCSYLFSQSWGRCGTQKYHALTGHKLQVMFKTLNIRTKGKCDLCDFNNALVVGAK